MRKATKDESSSSSSSEGESAFRSDSNSLKRSFRKRSSSFSEGNPLEDASSSPRQSTALPHERILPPSMYDDDARSASPSTYEKKALEYASSFHKEFLLPPRSREASPFSSFESKVEKFKSSERESKKNSKDVSPSESPPRNSKIESGSRSKRSRSRSRDRKNVHRSRSRSHGRSNRTKSPLRDRRRSQSKDHHFDRDRRRHSRSRSKRSRSRDSKMSRSRSRDSRRSLSRDSRRRSHSRNKESKRRSRSHSRDRRRSRSRSHDRHHHSRYRSSSRDRYRRKHYSRSRSRSRDRSKGRSGSGNRKPGSLPLSTSGGAMTPQMALQQTMAAMNAKAQALTGIALPKYYNPAAVNPLKYAEQVQKRKLLWQSSEKVEEQPKSSVWDKLTFAQDQDGKMTAKFRKLMGIKSENPKEAQEEEKESVLKKQEELFRDLDQQYEMARMTTHTQRGVGLGYSAQPLYPPVPK